MRIQEFRNIHSDTDTKSISEIVSRWRRESDPSEAMHHSITGGVVLIDLLAGDGTLDQISPELVAAFSSLLGKAVDTPDEIRQLLREKLAAGDASVMGMVNLVKGRVGELQFQAEAQSAGLHARLAESTNQEAWDIAVDGSDSITRYVQVKMQTDASAVVSDMQVVSGKVKAGVIIDGDTVVSKVDFAVPSEIAEEVLAKAEGLGLDIDVFPIEMSAAEAAEVVATGFNNVGPDAIANLLSELSGSFTAGLALHCAANAFLVYKGSKNPADYLSDTAEDAAISATAIAASMIVELSLGQLAILGGLPMFALVMGTTMASRAVLKRISRRGVYSDQLQDRNLRLEELNASLAAIR